MKRTITFIVMLCLFGMAQMANGQDVKINTNLVVESDGTLRSDGDATVWDDIMVFPDATSKGSSNPPSWALFKNNGATQSASQGSWLWFFDDETEQEVYFTIQIPHGYKVGSNLFPHVHWTTASGTPTGTNVVWGLEYTAIAIAGTFVNTTTITSNTVISLIGTPTGIGQHIITPLTTISGSGLGISSIIVCRLFRKTADASDTFGNSVGLLGFDVHYEKDTQGSRQEFIK